MLWLATMGWLVIKKVLPPLLIGEPPSYSRIVEAQRDAPPVGWRMSFNGRVLGWALNETRLQPTGLTDIYGRVHFDALPLDEMMPGWVRALTRLVRQPTDQLRMDTRSVLTIDALGHLLRFDSTMQVDPLDEVIRMRGTVEGRHLQLSVRHGGMSFADEVFLPTDALLSDVLSPQTQLPGLRAGQTWTVPIYSPLWSAKAPLEIVHATVEGSEPISWNGAIDECWLVVYRSDTGSKAADSRSPRGRLWVRRDGTVLRQQVNLFDSIIVFDRLSNEEAITLTDEAGSDWWKIEEERHEDFGEKVGFTADSMPFGGDSAVGPLMRWVGLPAGTSPSKKKETRGKTHD
jgi:hypothetical protein